MKNTSFTPSQRPTWAALLALLLPVSLSAQTESFEQNAFPNFDHRSSAVAATTPGAAVSAAAQQKARDQLRQKVKLVRIDRDALVGSPAFVGSPVSFLTGPGGLGGAVSDQALARQGAGDPYRAVKALVDDYPDLFGHRSDVLTAARVARDYVTGNNRLRSICWEQLLDNIPIFEATFQAHLTSQGELVNVASRLVPNPARAADRVAPGRSGRIAAPAVSAIAAVVAAANNIGEVVDEGDVVALDLPQGDEKKQHFQAPSLLEPQARYVWLPIDADTLRLSWEIILTAKTTNRMYRMLVDADSGEVVVRQNLTADISNATYSVFTSDSPSPMSPGLATPSSYQPPLVSRTLVTLAALDTNASPNGWIDDGVMETRGNNVDAHTDLDANNVADLPRPQAVGTDRVFNPPLDLTQSPSTYRDAAVVNLFYWCNFMHDKLYGLGFTEAAGNFQNDNFGRGGVGNDAVQADAQDGSGTNNANFSTPPDGSPGRMQMYVFNSPTPNRDGDLDAEVILHEYTHGLSNRLVGAGTGISAFQTAGMGEGWSDFYALSLLSEPADDVNGNYASGGYSSYLLNGGTQNYYFGIRRYPYSTDMTKDPLTFKDIDPTQASSHAGIPRGPNGSSSASEVHNVGEVWCIMLWEARANLVTKYGFSGSQLMLQLVTDGMKLAPANPTFVQARDAILQADFVDNGGVNRRALWQAFAKRGLGAGAVAPANSTTTGVVESYSLPEDLAINPVDPVVVGGAIGGPFATQTYVVANLGTDSLSWTANNTQSWLSLSPAAGTLAAGGNTTVAGNFTVAANALPQGTYNDTITFTNVTNGSTQTRGVTLVVAPAPAITSFSPTAVASGMNVIINGSGFVGPITVRFNGVPSTSVTVNSATQLTAVAPGSLTAGPITVTTAIGTATSPTNYTVTFVPTITGFTPTSGPNKRMVTLTGYNFSGGSVTSRSVTVNGVGVSSLTVSSTQLTFPVPVGATTGPIRVSTNIGSVTSATNFVVVAGSAPANDDFASPVVISGTSGSMNGGNTNATRQTGEPHHGGSAGGASVWFSWTAPSNGVYLFQPTDVGLNMGLVLGVYIGNSVDALQLIASGSANSPFSRYPSSAAFYATAGTTYRIAVDGYDGLMGEFLLTWATLGAPTITGFTSSAYAGQSVTVTGTGFAPGSSVSINGVAISASNLSYGSSTSLTILQLPSNVTSGPITVTTVAGKATSASSLNVISAPAPSISSITSSGQVGAQVTITGTALSLGPPSSPVVRFNGTAVATFVSQSATSLTVRVPTGATTGPITVQTTQGTATSASNFTVTTSSPPIPFIFGFVPASGPIGSSVTLSGANFLGVTSVQLNGQTVAFTINNDNQITAVVPTGATSGVFRTIANTTSTTSSASFSITNPPTISGFSPATVNAGTQVVITGTNFSGVSTVAFNGLAAPFAVNSNTQITAVVPGGTLLGGPITVTTPDGSATSATSFVVGSDAPTITTFSPSALAARQQVIITGTNFSDATTVTFNGVSGSFTVNSSTQITATAPSALTAGAIKVTTTKGTATSPFNYTIAAPAAPAVTAFSPAAIATGLPVTITGSGFSDVTSVLFNGVATTSFTVISPTQILATAPSSNLTAGPITVITSLGSSTSATSYTLTTVPIIASFTPDSGPANRLITVTGTNFLTGVTSFTVRVNGVSATSTSRNNNQVIFPIPPGAATGPITITTNNGVATSETNFVVVTGLPPPNDNFANAIVISGTSSFTTGTLANATKEAGEPNHAGNAGGNSVWFAWTAPASGWYLFNPYDSTKNQYGVMESIYTGTAVNALTLVASGLTPTSAFARYGSAAALNATAGITYRIAIDGYNGLQPDYKLTWSPLSAPTVTSFSPSSGYAGQSVSMSINGTNFVPGASIMIGGAAVDPTKITYNSSISMTVTQIPPSAVLGSGPVTVTTVVGSRNSTAVFNVVPPPPSISGFTPTAAPVGAPVVISGANFTGATAVTFNGTSAAFVVGSSSQITATVPTGATSGPIGVTTAGGVATSTATFRVIVPPVISQQPASLTATVGDTVSFSVTAVSNASMQYQWQKDGVPITGNTSAVTSTLTLINIHTADAAAYSCFVSNVAGGISSASATLTVNKAQAAVNLTTGTFTYDGQPKSATVTTIPAGLNVDVTYNGAAAMPVNAGTYAVVATVNSPDYTGSANGTLSILPAAAGVVLTNLTVVYDGTPKPVGVVTSPAGLANSVTYDGSSTAPRDVGSYAVVVTVTNPNYVGTATGTLKITPAPAEITLSGLAQRYDGTPRIVSTTTVPAGLQVVLTYAGGSDAPWLPGSYPVVATIDDPNYKGTATDTLSVVVTALVRHGPNITADLDGSIQVLAPEDVMLASTASIAGDLLVPGTPALRVNGNPTYGSAIDAGGAATPSDHVVTLNGNAVLRHLVRQVDALTLTPVEPPPAPTGTRDIHLNAASDGVRDFSDVRDITLNANAGDVAIPAGTYGTLAAANNAAIVLGVEGATAPAVYNLQGLVLNPGSVLRVAGPVSLVVGGDVVVKGEAGDPSRPQWLTMRIANGGLELRGGATLAGRVLAPDGTIAVSSATLKGTIEAATLLLDSGGVIEEPRD